MRIFLVLMCVFSIVGCSAESGQATFPDKPAPMPEGGPAQSEPPAAPPPSNE